jgi:4-hydroxybenzoyl-CoA reductase subunit beta
MMRLPRFEFHEPRELATAARMLAERPGQAMLLAGGTDLLPNMKRRQQTPAVLISVARLPELKAVTEARGLSLGAGFTLSEIVRMPSVQERYTALWQAAAQVATPHLRAMGTLGGNLCLDTRCNYYDQNYEWRKAIDFCMKKDGEICWVATSSPKCLAVSSTDTAPALIALGARVRLAGPESARDLALDELYANDGIHYLTKQPAEILTAIDLPDPAGWRSTYWKLRRRGSFDFPVLGVAAAAKVDEGGIVHDARIVLGAVASRPLPVPAAADVLRGQPLTDDVIAAAADRAYEPAKPMDNTDFTLHWRKRVVRDFVTYALCELRGDDMRERRVRVARHALQGLAH